MQLLRHLHRSHRVDQPQFGRVPRDRVAAAADKGRRCWFHRQQTWGRCDTVRFESIIGVYILTLRRVLNVLEPVKVQSCKLQASPKCSAWFLCCTNTSDHLPRYTPSMAGLLMRASSDRCQQIETQTERLPEKQTSTGVINSKGFCHCVCFVCTL